MPSIKCECLSDDQKLSPNRHVILRNRWRTGPTTGCSGLGSGERITARTPRFAGRNSGLVQLVQVPVTSYNGRDLPMMMDQFAIKKASPAGRNSSNLLLHLNYFSCSSSYYIYPAKSTFVLLFTPIVNTLTNSTLATQLRNISTLLQQQHRKL